MVEKLKNALILKKKKKKRFLILSAKDYKTVICFSLEHPGKIRLDY